MLASLVCLFASPHAVSREPRGSGVPVVASYDDLRDVVEQMSLNLNTETSIRPAGSFKSIERAFGNLNYYGFSTTPPITTSTGERILRMFSSR